jgi:two-component system chemotaxis response regulator CheB
VAREKIVALKPDVITLDIIMPRMDGLTFLGKLMKHYPLPVIIVSALTKEGGDLALAAMDQGAVDVIAKPSENYSTNDMIVQLVDKIRATAQIHTPDFGRREKQIGKRKAPRPTTPLIQKTIKVIAIGSSTGGTAALREVLPSLPPSAPGILIVRHMPPNFTTSFAKSLNKICRITVKEAEDGDAVLPGLALLAPGNFHMVLRQANSGYHVQIGGGPLVCHQRPSVDVLFNSVAAVCGSKALGVILTGMGYDGAGGMLTMHNAGAKNISQDKESCVVFGMPEAAIAAGGVDKIVPLENISQTILEML